MFYYSAYFFSSALPFMHMGFSGSLAHFYVPQNMCRWLCFSVLFCTCKNFHVLNVKQGLACQVVSCDKQLHINKLTGYTLKQNRNNVQLLRNRVSETQESSPHLADDFVRLRFTTGKGSFLHGSGRRRPRKLCSDLESVPA